MPLARAGEALVRVPAYTSCILTLRQWKAQILLSGWKNWKAESPHTIVCRVRGRNRANCLAIFGTKQTVETTSPSLLFMDTSQPLAASPITGCMVLCGFENVVYME